MSDKEVTAYWRERNNERERVAVNQALLSWGRLVCSVAEAEMSMYTKMARELVEAGHHRTAQTMCFDVIAHCGKRYSKLLTLTDMSDGWESEKP